MLAHWESKIKSSSMIYRKMATLHARLAKEGGVLKTIVGGVTEARKSYEKGDFILIGSRGGSYSMRAVDFSSRYDRLRPEPASDPTLASEGFRRYQPIGEVFAHELLAEDIQRLPSGKFMGKWGAPVSVEVGDYLVCPHPEGGEIYSTKRDLFHKSYIQRPVSVVRILLEAEVLPHWDMVFRQDGHLCRKKRTVYAKVADVDGKLDQISTTQPKPSNEDEGSYESAFMMDLVATTDLAAWESAIPNVGDAVTQPNEQGRFGDCSGLSADNISAEV